MSRKVCKQCHKPIKACICDFVTPIENDIEVLVLQHPKEVGHAKGSLGILARSLMQCQVIVGEAFEDDPILAKAIDRHENIVLLYPSEGARPLNARQIDKDCAPITCIILIDATWKKAYKVFQLSPQLQAISHVKLADGYQGQYDIRRTSKENALSTLEACCYALGEIEQNPKKYQPMINSFVQFNKFQLSFRPSHHIQE